MMRADSLEVALERAEEAFGEGRRREGLEGLLLAWRLCWAPELAELIIRLGGAFKSPAPVWKKKKKDRIAQWLELSRRDDPRDVEALLEALDEIHKTDVVPSVIGCADELLRKEADPRISDFVAERFERPRDTGRSAMKIVTRFGRLLELKGDPRVLPALRRVARRERELEFVFRSYFQDYLNGRLDKISAAVEGRGGEAIGGLAQRCRAIEALALSTPEAEEPTAEAEVVLPQSADDQATGEELLRMVYEAPGDDGPRQILADWLVERGDPRGELINLQMLEERGEATKRTRGRVNSLIRQHQREWLGPLAPLTILKTVEFRRGFPARGKVRPLKPFEREVEEAHPEWATFEELRFEGGREPKRRTSAVVSPHMRGAKALIGLCNQGLHRLCDLAEVIPAEKVFVITAEDGFGSGGPRSRSLKRFAKAPPPTCTHLGLFKGRHTAQDVERYTWLFDTALGAQLETLTVPAGRGASAIKGWMEASDEVPLRSVGFVDDPIDCEEGSFLATLGRGEDGRLSVLSLTLRQHLPEGAQLLKKLLWACKPLTALKVSLGGTSYFISRTRDILETEGPKLTGLEEITVELL